MLPHEHATEHECVTPLAVHSVWGAFADQVFVVISSKSIW